VAMRLDSMNCGMEITAIIMEFWMSWSVCAMQQNAAFKAG
jgi:hypothetical protein